MYRSLSNIKSLICNNEDALRVPAVFWENSSTDIYDVCSNGINHAAWSPDINNDTAATAADAQIVYTNISM